MAKRPRPRDDSDTIYVSASNLAALTGYHPFTSLPQLWTDLVYQGRLDLLRRDAAALGLTLVSAEQALQELARKADAQDSLQQVILARDGKATLHSGQEAQQLQQRVVQTARDANKLSPSELAQLKEGARSLAFTSFGIQQEEHALDAYEKYCGSTIHERNAQVREWAFRRAMATL